MKLHVFCEYSGCMSDRLPGSVRCAEHADHEQWDDEDPLCWVLGCDVIGRFPFCDLHEKEANEILAKEREALSNQPIATPIAKERSKKE